MVDDWFDKNSIDIANLEVRTDGVWVWPGDLPYYVRRSGVEVPAEMLAHMAKRGWTAPPLTQEELLAAEKKHFE